MLRVNEIFTSIQGEGYWTGLPVVFLRLQGCNLKCQWCDTYRAVKPDGGKLWHMGELLHSIRNRKPATVVITGGEPMMQAQDVYALIGAECSRPESYLHWHLETNGTLPVNPQWFNWITVSPKPPDYTIHDSVWPHWDELKIVVDGPAAIRAAEWIAEEEGGNATFRQPIILQPESNDPEMIKLIFDYLTDKRDWARRWRLGVQMHKYIGVE